MIISDGTRVAALLDGFLTVKLEGFILRKKETSDPTLSIEGIATEVFKANGAMEFERIWISFLQNELGKK